MPYLELSKEMIFDTVLVIEHGYQVTDLILLIVEIISKQFIIELMKRKKCSLICLKNFLDELSQH